MNIASQLTATLILVIVSIASPASSTSLEELPTGEYYYEELSTSEVARQYVLLHKAGRIVIGVHLSSQSGNPCFRGFVEQNRIVHATRVFPPYDPASDWDVQEEMLDLSDYRRVDSVGTAIDRDTLQTCIDFLVEP